MKKVCIELSYRYIKGQLKKLITEYYNKINKHYYDDYHCPVIEVNENDLSILEKLCNDNKCKYSILA